MPFLRIGAAIGLGFFAIFVATGTPFMEQEKGNKKKSFLKRIRHKYRFVVLNEQNFEERLSFRLSRLNVLTASLFVVLVSVAITTAIIFFTPIREAIPGYSNNDIRQHGEKNALLVDTLQGELKVLQNYQERLVQILNGTIGDQDSTLANDIETAVADTIRFAPSLLDSQFREDVEAEDQYSLSFDTDGDAATTAREVLFFAPLRGEVSSAFDARQGHHGVDITAGKNESIKATLDGTVIQASWTAQDGYVIYIQHSNNYISGLQTQLCSFEKSG